MSWAQKLRSVSSLHQKLRLDHQLGGELHVEFDLILFGSSYALPRLDESFGTQSKAFLEYKYKMTPIIAGYWEIWGPHLSSPDLTPPVRQFAQHATWQHTSWWLWKLVKSDLSVLKWTRPVRVIMRDSAFLDWTPMEISHCHAGITR